MLKSQYKKFFLKIANIAKKKLSSAPGCHDWDHTARVLRNSQIICASEKNAKKELVEIAALLHDIARGEDMNKKDRKCHAINGAKIAKKILEKFDFLNKNFINNVCLCVKRHRYRGKERPLSIEEKIVYDADKLDSLGAVGIARAFHFAGRIGSRLHNNKKDALNAKSYSREDTAYREYLVKMRHLPKKMLTKTGKKLAIKRAKFMEIFFKELQKESGK